MSYDAFTAGDTGSRRLTVNYFIYQFSQVTDSDSESLKNHRVCLNFAGSSAVGAQGRGTVRSVPLHYFFKSKKNCSYIVHSPCESRYSISNYLTHL